MVGVRVITGSGVRASVRDRQIDGPANAAFDRLAREFGLFWFSDGSVVYVDPVEDNKTKFFRVKNTSSSAIENTLDAAGLGKHRDRVKVVGNDGLVRATGPESFLKIVETMLTGIETDKGSVQIIRFGQKTN
jgi:type III secretion protein C